MKKRYQVNKVTQELERSEVEQLQAELRQAQRELEIVRQERDILKKTIRNGVLQSYPATFRVGLSQPTRL